MRATVVATVIVLGLGTGGSYADTPLRLSAPCAVITDPAGDVEMAGAPQTAGHVSDEHLDLRAVDVLYSRSALRVTFRDTRLSRDRRGIWRLTFTSRGKQVFVTAGTGLWVNAGTADATDGYYAGVSGERQTSVRGIADYARSAIVVDVPLSAFGAAAPRPGTSLSRFGVEATEQLVNVAPLGIRVAEAALVDRASSSKTVVVGRRC
jgi:hypothetical protein